MGSKYNGGDKIMEIKDIINHNVKASKGSITIKNENDKTIGIVMNLTRFNDLQANKKILYSKLLRDSDVWGNSKINMDNCYVLDNKVYLLKNLRSCKYYSEEEQIDYDDMYLKISNNGINVIECYII